MPGIISLFTGFHIIAVVHYYFVLHYIATKFKLPHTEEFRMFNSFGGHYRFLTNWDLIIQAIFFTICLINDVIGTNEVRPRKTPFIRKLKDFLHTSIGFPLAAFVASTFWVLYAIDRELVFPKALDPFFPTWLNHVMHTNIIIFSLLELVTSFRVYPSRKRGLSSLLFVLASYLIWRSLDISLTMITVSLYMLMSTFIIFGKTGRWVYPVMEVLNWPLRILFCLSLIAYSVFLYFVGEALNNLVWSKELTLVGVSKKSTKRKVN